MALLDAAENGDADQVKQLLAEGAPVDKAGAYGYTALHLAAMENHPAVVAILLHHHASVDLANDNGMTALHLAAMENHLPVVVILLDHHASVDLTDDTGEWIPLHCASYGGHTDVMRHLLAAGASRDIANDDGRTPLQCAEMCDHTAVAELLKEWPKNLTPIMNAVAMRNDVSAVRE